MVEDCNGNSACLERKRTEPEMGMDEIVKELKVLQDTIGLLESRLYYCLRPEKAGSVAVKDTSAFRSESGKSEAEITSAPIVTSMGEAAEIILTCRRTVKGIQRRLGV